MTKSLSKCAVYHIEIIYNYIFCAIWKFEFTFLKLQHEWWQTETCISFFGIKRFHSSCCITQSGLLGRRKKNCNRLQPLPGVINIASILIKWRRRIASHTRGHLARKQPLCSVFFHISGISAVLPLSWDGWDAVEWKHRKLSCRTTGVCLSGNVTRILIPGYELRQRLIVEQPRRLFVS